MQLMECLRNAGLSKAYAKKGRSPHGISRVRNSLYVLKLVIINYAKRLVLLLKPVVMR